MMKRRFQFSELSLAKFPHKIQFIFYFVLLVCLSFSISCKSHRANKYFKEGLELEGKGFCEEAIPLYEKAVTIKPTFPDALYHLGVCYSAVGDVPRAIEWLEKAVEKKGDYEEAQAKLGELYLKMGRFGKAVETYKRLAELKPENNTYLVSLGEALVNQGDYLEALKYLSKAVEITPDYRAYYFIGVSKGKLGDWEGAIEFLSKANELKPDFAEALSAKARALYELKRYDEALASAQSAIQANPHYHNAHVVLGMIYHAKGDMESYQREVELLESVNPGLAGILKMYIAQHTSQPK